MPYGEGQSYLPEFQGLTGIQQRKYSNQMTSAADQLRKSQKRSNLQSGGAYMEAKGKQGTQLAQGLSDIEQINQYKNATLARDERLTGQRRKWQVEDRDLAYSRQDEAYKRQQQNQIQQMLGGAIGTGASMIFGPAISGVGKQIGNYAQYGQRTSPQQDYYTQYMNNNYGQRPSAGSSGPYYGD